MKEIVINGWDDLFEFVKTKLTLSGVWLGRSICQEWYPTEGKGQRTFIIDVLQILNSCHLQACPTIVFDRKGKEYHFVIPAYNDELERLEDIRKLSLFLTTLC